MVSLKKYSAFPTELFTFQQISLALTEFLGICLKTSLVAQMVKNLPAMQETWVRSMGWEDLPEEEMATHSSTLAGEPHGHRSLAGCCPWGRKSQT